MEMTRIEGIDAGLANLGEVEDEVSADDQVDQVTKSIIRTLPEAPRDGMKLLGDLVAQGKTADHPRPLDPELVRGKAT
jgi:hypothetical protein